MDWDHLRYFLAVAESGKLLRAARKLGVNHSTMFRRVNRLERDLNARLFERLKEGYVLTPAGEALLAHARRVEEEMNALQLRLSGQDVQPSGTVRVTAPENLAYRYLPDYLRRFARRFPDIRIELVVGAESLDLSRREADVAVRATVSPPEHLVGRRSVSCPWTYVASRAYLKRHGRPDAHRALAAHLLIGADGRLARLPPFRRMERALSDGIGIRCNTLNGMAALAAAGHGIALLPADQGGASLQRLFACEPAFATGIWLLTHPELRHVERVRRLMRHLHASFGADRRLCGSG